MSVANAGDATESLTSGTFRYTVSYSGHAPATVVKWLQSDL